MRFCKNKRLSIIIAFLNAIIIDKSFILIKIYVKLNSSYWTEQNKYNEWENLKKENNIIIQLKNSNQITSLIIIKISLIKFNGIGADIHIRIAY